MWPRLGWGIGGASPQVQGQNLDRAGTCPCTDPQEYLMVQGHSSDQTQAWCRATPVDHTRASERSEPHQVFLWIGAGTCPSTIQVLAQHPGKNPQKSMENSKSFMKRASVRRKMLIFCPLGIVSNGESIWRGPAMVWKARFEENGFFDPDRCRASPVPPKTGRCRASPVLGRNPEPVFDRNGAPWGLMVQGQSRLSPDGGSYLLAISDRKIASPMFFHFAKVVPW